MATCHFRAKIYLRHSTGRSIDLRLLGIDEIWPAFFVSHKHIREAIEISNIVRYEVRIMACSRQPAFSFCQKSNRTSTIFFNKY